VTGIFLHVQVFGHRTCLILDDYLGSFSSFSWLGNDLNRTDPRFDRVWCFGEEMDIIDLL